MADTTSSLPTIQLTVTWIRHGVAMPARPLSVRPDVRAEALGRQLWEHFLDVAREAESTPRDALRLALAWSTDEGGPTTLELRPCEAATDEALEYELVWEVARALERRPLAPS